MSPNLVVLIIFIVASIIFLGIFSRLIHFYKKVPQGKAVIRTGQGGIQVSFNGIWVIPIIHKMEIIDISLKKLSIERLDKDSVFSKDMVRVNLKVLFFLQVQPNANAIVKVARQIGVERASELQTLQELFEAKFSGAIKTVAKDFTFLDLINYRDEFQGQIKKYLHSEDLNGFQINDLQIETLEMTPKSCYDPDNIMDHHGLKRLEELKNEKFD